MLPLRAHLPSRNPVLAGSRHAVVLEQQVVAAAGAVPEADLALVEVEGGLGTAEHGVVVRR